MRRIRRGRRGGWAGAAVAAVVLGLLSPVAAAAAPVSPVAVALCIDAGAPMAKADPQGTRLADARAVAAALGGGDRIAVVSCAARPRVLLPLTRAGGTAAARAIASVGAGGAVGVLAGLQAAAAQLAADPRAGDRHLLVYVGGGVPDSGGGETLAARAALEAEARAVADHGWALDVVGIGAGADHDQLLRLATLGHGHYWLAPATSVLPGDLGLPATAPSPVRLRLRAGVVVSPLRPGVAQSLPLHATNSARVPEVLGLRPHGLPAGWRLPATLTVPPGSTTLGVALTPAPARGAVRLRVAVRAPTGVQLTGAALVWRLRVAAVSPRPAARASVRPGVWMRPGPQALVLAVAVAGLLLLVGFGGYALRVAPRRRLHGSLEVAGPAGEPLGRLVLPARRTVAVGGGERGALNPPGLPGEGVVFHLQAEVVTAGGRWRSGLAAWREPPETIVLAEAAWPYHLYPGPLPQRRIELYDGMSFGAAGLTFTFRQRARHASGEAVGEDLLRDLSPESTRDG